MLQCAPLLDKKGGLSALSFGGGVKVRDLIQLFLQLEQMQGAGVPMLAALSDAREGSDNDKLRDIMTDIHRGVEEGSSLSESMEAHSNVFKPLYISLISAGEETGDIISSYRSLIKYLKWLDDMQSKIRKATRYPMVVSVVVFATIIIMMAFVVPSILGFITYLDQEIPFYTKALMVTSDFFSGTSLGVVPNALLVVVVPVLLFFVVKLLRAGSDSVTYQLDALALSLPIAGELIRKINIARFSQTFGALFASGVDVLKSIDSAKKTVGNAVLLEALDTVYERVHAGAPLSEAFNETGEFPTMVIRILKIGEESGNLMVVLEQVSDFYTKDVDEAVEGLITMIEPMLTAFMGLIICWIAIAVFGPIYSSFENIDI